MTYMQWFQDILKKQFLFFLIKMKRNTQKRSIIIFYHFQNRSAININKHVRIQSFIVQFFKMIKKYLFLLCLILFFLEAKAQDSNQKTIPSMMVNQIAYGQIYKADRYKNFHLMNVPTLDKKYLFFTLTTEQIYQHINLTLLIYKQGSQIPLERCYKDELDSCYIPNNQITMNQTLFIIVETDSQIQLSYKIRAYWSDLEHIQLGKDNRFIFSATEQRQLYHLQLKGKEFKELRIIIKPQTRRFAFDKIKMYGTFGENSNPSAQYYDFKSFPLWEDAEGVYLYRSELKELNMNLVLYGVTETVYTMRCDLVNETHNQVAINSKIYEYLEPLQSNTYFIKFKDANDKYFFQNYAFRLSIFTGNLDLKFYKDQANKQRITDLVPYMYMGDIQYVLKKEVIDKIMPNGMYIVASSQKRISTFMMEFQGRAATLAVELHQHIYQFISVEKRQLTYFTIGKFQLKQTIKNQIIRVTFTELSVLGKVAIEFRLCNKTENQCFGPNYAQNTIRIPPELRQVGSKSTFTLNIMPDMFNNVNFVQKHALIVVILTNLQQNITSFSAIEYNVGNRPEFLRQNKPIQSHIMKSQLKIYKYVCQDTSVKKVKVYINQIYGSINVFSFRREPTPEQLTQGKGEVRNGLIEVEEKLTEEPIVIVLSGVDSATYSIVVQTIHSDTQQVSFITLSEDVEFSMKIPSNKYQIYQVVPVLSSIYFNYKATGPLNVCVLGEDKTCQDELPGFSNSGNFSIERFFNRKAYIKVKNPSSRVVQVTSIFHSKKNDHCQLTKMGQLVSEVITEGKCLYTIIDKIEDFQVMLIHQEYAKFSYNLLLCDKLLSFSIKENNQERFLVTKDQINNNCKDHAERTFSFFVLGDIKRWESGKPSIVEKINIKYIAQFVNSTIMLPDGVGYHTSEVSKEGPIKKLAYNLLNFVDTTILLSTSSRLFFLAKIVDNIHRDQVTMSIEDNHFSSPVEKFYFLDSIYLKILAEQLQRSKCDPCTLVIFVYSQEQVGKIVDFTIEVIQNFKVLEEGKQVKNYLNQNSKAHYSYVAKGKGSIIVQVSDNNQKCAELYVSRNEFPDQNNNDQHSYDGEIIIEKTNEQPATFYISVKARQHCSFTIGTTQVTGQQSIHKLERGVLSPLSLKKDEVKYFTFSHLSSNPFKILSLHKYGSIHFYLNITTPEKVGQFMNQKTETYQKFTYRSDEQNRLYLQSKSQYFCKGCFYILAAVATKHTESSLYLGDDETKIPITQDKIINDILPTALSYTRGQFYPIEKGIIDAKVHSGKLQVTLQYKDQSIIQIFQKSEKKVERKINFNIIKGYYGTVTVIFKALAANTVYSLRIASERQAISQQTGKEYTTVNPSEINYFTVKESKQGCLKGFLRDSDQKVFVSFSSYERENALRLTLSGLLDSKQANITRDISRNVMSITFDNITKGNFSKALPYQICFTSDNATIVMIAMQTQETSLLPENLEVPVTGKQTYNIYPQGQFLLDIFECRGTASIVYGSSGKELQIKKQKVLESAGMPDQPHAVKIESGWSNLLLRVNSPLSLIRWLPIKQQDQKGIGYYLYSAGSLKYDSSFGTIELIVKPLKNLSKKTKTKIFDIKYNLYISDSEQDLQEASQCERYLPGSVLQYRTIHQQIFTSSFKFSIDKTKLIEKYKEGGNLFAVIVANLALVTPDNYIEHYRFIYNQQEIPGEIYTPNKLERFNMVLLIVFLVLLIFAVLAIGWLCVRVCVPMIGRLKNRMLVEEQGLQTSKDKDIQIKEDQIEPPPSSQRQTITNVDNPPDTEVRM